MRRFRELITRSRKELEACELDYSRAVGFAQGGQWMAGVLGHDAYDGDRYLRWGILKYSLACMSFPVSALVWGFPNVPFVVSSVLLFYLIEVHFLFLFPLMADGSKHLLVSSLRATYRVGVFRAVGTVIPLALHMLSGLLNFKQPLYNWYVCCMSIIIWYRDEVRARL